MSKVATSRLAPALVTAVLLLSASSAHALPLKTDEKDPDALARLLIAPQGQYRSVVALSLRSAMDPVSSYFCSGSVIAPTWVLTVAHCVVTGSEGRQRPVDSALLRVLVDSADLRKSRPVEVSQVIIHPQWNGGIEENNIALVQLKSPVGLPVLSIARQPAFTALRREEGTGSLVVAGWGMMVESDQTPDMSLMRHLSVRMITNENCNQPESYDGKVTNLQFCAASVIEHVDVCQGFSGAPLIAFDAIGRQFAVGLVSWGEGCARKLKPTVYTDIGSYIDWIEQQTGKLENSPAISLLRTIDPNTPASAADTSERLVNPSPNIAPTGLFRYMVSIGKAHQNQGLDISAVECSLPPTMCSRPLIA